MTTLDALKVTTAHIWAEFEAETVDPLAEARAKAAQEEIDEIETARKIGTVAVAEIESGDEAQDW